MIEKLVFNELPGFRETLFRIARVPGKDAPKEIESFSYNVIDEVNKITYRFISPRKLSAADVRRAMVREFNRTDAWPNESGVVEINL